MRLFRNILLVIIIINKPCSVFTQVSDTSSALNYPYGIYADLNALKSGNVLYGKVFTLKEFWVGCGYFQSCMNYKIIFPKEIKKQIVKAPFKFVSDSLNLYINPGDWQELEHQASVYLLQNKGQYRFFVKDIWTGQGTARVECYIDMQTSEIVVIHRKTMKQLFADFPELLNEYLDDHSKSEKMPYYFNKFNVKLLERKKILQQN